MKVITASLQVHERIMITGLEIMCAGVIDTGTHECIRLVSLLVERRIKVSLKSALSFLGYDLEAIGYAQIEYCLIQITDQLVFHFEVHVPVSI